MARLTAKQRAALPKSAFAVPSKAPGPGSYPVPDKAHAANAKARAAANASPAQQKVINAKANRILKETPAQEKAEGKAMKPGPTPKGKKR